MENTIAITTSLLNQLANQLSRLSPEEIRKIEEGTARVTVLVDGKPIKKAFVRKVDPFDPEIEDIIENLRSMDKREEGASLIRNSLPLKADMLRLGKRLDIPISREDNVDRIVDRIVEATIGFRLRSHAIQSHNG